jgi:hypothetical protein
MGRCTFRRTLGVSTGVAMAVVAGHASAETVDARQANPSTTITSELFSNLPLASRGFAALIAIEPGVSSSDASSAVNTNFGPSARGPLKYQNYFFGVDAAVSTRQPAPDPSRRFGPAVQLAGPGLTFGVKYRSYFGDGGSLRFQTGPGTDTVFRFSRDWMVMPYMGVPYTAWQPSLPLGARSVTATPYIGPIFERGKFRLSFNETPFGGGAGEVKRDINRYGVGLGVNFDFRFPSTGAFTPFIGAGGQASFLWEKKEPVRTEPLGLRYDIHIEHVAEARATLRAGAAFE